MAKLMALSHRAAQCHLENKIEKLANFKLFPHELTPGTKHTTLLRCDMDLRATTKTTIATTVTQITQSRDFGRFGQRTRQGNRTLLHSNTRPYTSTYCPTLLKLFF